MDSPLPQSEELAMKYLYFNQGELLYFSSHSWVARNYQDLDKYDEWSQCSEGKTECSLRWMQFIGPMKVMGLAK